MPTLDLIYEPQQMLFAVIFTDKPGRGALRAEQLEAHIRWVAKHKANVLVAGSLRVEPGAVPEGGLWIVEAPSKDFVLDLMKSDPFYTSGLRQDIKVMHWFKALPEKVPV